MHCWQGDDVAGFENPGGSLTGGIQATGNYPGKARNATELRADLEQALSLIPGPKRLNLHAIYLESDTPVARDQIKPEHFKNWVEWAKANQLGLDFNPSCFSHPLSADGFHAGARRRHHSPVFDRSLQSQPSRLGVFWRAVGYTIGDEHLDPGWHERHHR